MIQRKQTLFLLLSALCMGLACALPWMDYLQRTPQRSFELRAYGVFTEAGLPVADMPLTVPFVWLYAFVAVACLVVVFLYRDRPRQARFTRTLYLLMLGCFAGQVLAHRSVASYLGPATDLDTTWLPGFFIVLAAGVSTWLAERGIRADEALVKSMDRLR